MNICSIINLFVYVKCGGVLILQKKLKNKAREWQVVTHKITFMIYAADCCRCHFRFFKAQHKKYSTTEKLIDKSLYDLLF